MSGNVEARAITSLARALWDGLTLAQRGALRLAALTHWHDSPTNRTVRVGTNQRTITALRGRGLIADRDRDLTPLGLLVRAEGIAADKADAQRRYSRRKSATARAA